MYNQSFLKENGAEKFIALQERRMALLKSMLRDYDDGRCKSLFCLAAALLSIEALSGALLAAETEVKAGAVAADDKKSKAGLLKRLLGRAAEEENAELRLRKRN